MSVDQSEHWAMMPASQDSVARKIGALATRKNIKTAIIEKPVFGKASSGKAQWVSPNEFRFIPATLLPTRQNFPFNGNAPWNGSEIFSNPRAGRLIRDEGFARVEFLIVEHFHLIPMIRSFQAKKLVVIIGPHNFPGKNDPNVIQKRWIEVAEDSDVLFIEKSVAQKIRLRSEPPLISSYDESDPKYIENIFDQLGSLKCEI